MDWHSLDNPIVWIGGILGAMILIAHFTTGLGGYGFHGFGGDPESRAERRKEYRRKIRRQRAKEKKCGFIR